MFETHQHLRHRFLDWGTRPVEFACCRRCKLGQQESIWNVPQGAKDQLRSHTVLQRHRSLILLFNRLAVFRAFAMPNQLRADKSRNVVERAGFFRFTLSTSLPGISCGRRNFDSSRRPLTQNGPRSLGPTPTGCRCVTRCQPSDRCQQSGRHLNAQEPYGL